MYFFGFARNLRGRRHAGRLRQSRQNRCQRIDLLQGSGWLLRRRRRRARSRSRGSDIARWPWRSRRLWLLQRLLLKLLSLARDSVEFIAHGGKRLFKIFCHLLALITTKDDMGSDQHDQLGSKDCITGRTEETSDDGYVHNVRNASPRMGTIIGDDAADREGITILYDRSCLGLPCVKSGKSILS